MYDTQSRTGKQTCKHLGVSCTEHNKKQSKHLSQDSQTATGQQESIHGATKNKRAGSVTSQQQACACIIFKRDWASQQA
eukprot:1160641-Pelagomonas_calceolata.AAC.7